MITLIKVGITGQDGFIGSHLYNFLGTKKDKIERISFKTSYFDNEQDLQGFVKLCDVIIHSAAVNRHEDMQVLYETNVELVNKLVSACMISKSRPKIIFCSSTQEKMDNMYAKSKIKGRIQLESFAKKIKSGLTSLIIPNVFGPFGKPFYNSFIATFSHQIISGEEPKVIKDSLVKLIYINELVEVFYEEIINWRQKKIKKYSVSYTSEHKVSEILELLKFFKNEYVDNGKVPKVDLNTFELNLFNTFTSFIKKNFFPVKFIKHIDNRGSFVEIIRSNTAGQTSFSTTHPGVTRGNHYHTRKIERFAVISGKASIKIRKIDSGKVYEYILDGKSPAYVDMPIWHTHNITNIGNDDLITLFWINEPYDPRDPDTYFMNV